MVQAVVGQKTSLGRGAGLSSRPQLRRTLAFEDAEDFRLLDNEVFLTVNLDLSA